MQSSTTTLAALLLGVVALLAASAAPALVAAGAADSDDEFQPFLSWFNSIGGTAIPAGPRAHPQAASKPRAAAASKLHCTARHTNPQQPPFIPQARLHALA